MVDTEGIDEGPAPRRDPGKAYPCPSCGYDLRATKREAGKFPCPECGSTWTDLQLQAHADEPYVSGGKLLLWTFGMPVLYSFLVFAACMCGVSFLVQADESELVGWVVFWTHLTLMVSIIAAANRGMAGRWASRVTRNPVLGGVRSGGWYWGMLLSLTAIQMACAYVYPLIGVGLCFSIM